VVITPTGKPRLRETPEPESPSEESRVGHV
jgi:hypothetical protein